MALSIIHFSQYFFHYYLLLILLHLRNFSTIRAFRSNLVPPPYFVERRPEIPEKLSGLLQVPQVGTGTAALIVGGFEVPAHLSFVQGQANGLPGKHQMGNITLSGSWYWWCFMLLVVT